MKLFTFLFAALTVLVASVQVYAWDNLDHEIFDMVSELEGAEGKGMTFYKWLEVSPTASTGEIAKAYRKKSITLHPDKNPNVKGVHERFARLGKVSTILRNKEKRERYDFFHKNGVPVWRGTGYYYARFRPGLGTVLGFLVILTSGLQYLVQSMNHKRDIARIETITAKAKAAAWGPRLIPINGQRKVRVNLGEAHDEDGRVTDSRWIDMVVDGPDVFMIDDNGELVIIDSSTAIAPAVSRTWFLSLLSGLLSRVTGKKDKADAFDDNASAGDDDSESAAGSDTPGSGAATPNGTLKAGHAAAAKAGGKRRKAVNKKR